MSLDWKFPGYDSETSDPYLKKYLRIMVLATMAVDIGEISEKTLDEWLFRVEVMRKVKLPFGNHFVPDEDGKQFEGFPEKGNFEDIYPDEAMLTKFFGLRTNVCTEKRAAWLKRLWAGITRDCERDAKHRRPMKEPS
jgi:hypothetical protein